MDKSAIAGLEKELQWKRINRGLDQPPIDEFMVFIGSRLDRDRKSLLTHLGRPAYHGFGLWEIPLTGYPPATNISSQPDWHTAWHGSQLPGIGAALCDVKLFSSMGPEYGERIKGGQ